MCYQVSLINFSRCKSNLMLAGNGLFGTKCRLVDGQFLYRIILFSNVCHLLATSRILLLLSANISLNLYFWIMIKKSERI